MASVVRVGYSLEQCWHRVPGGTAVAALEALRELMRRDDLSMIGVAGHHAGPPPPPWTPPVEVRSVRGAGARLYASWVLAGRPTIESACGPVDVAHATTIVPCASRAPLVVTVHDLAFVHEPAHFTRWGTFLFRRSLAAIRRRAELVLCSSQATADDVVAAGVAADRIRIVPLGVRVPARAPDRDEVDRVRRSYGLPERYALFVGTLEPRKNLARLADAVRRCDRDLVLAVAGPQGWGNGTDTVPESHVCFLGFVPGEELPALYAGAAVVGYPSLREGFGLPVLEAMAAGAPVVTSRGTATEEVAGGAAVLVDPRSVDDIARGLAEAMAGRDRLVAAGRRRAGELSWANTARLTAAAYREAAGA